jgi:hypothetical protein
MARLSFARSRIPGRPALPLALALALAAGCGESKPLVPVAGRVTVKNQPLASGTVVFYPDPEKGNQEKREPRATIAGDRPGAYRLKTDGRDGAPAGWYKVTVNALKPVTGAMRPPEWLADPKYTDVKTSGLAVEVRKDAGSGAYDFDLNPPK